jgi:hypothetical protein
LAPACVKKGQPGHIYQNVLKTAVPTEKINTGYLMKHQLEKCQRKSESMAALPVYYQGDTEKRHAYNEIEPDHFIDLKPQEKESHHKVTYSPYEIGLLCDFIKLDVFRFYFFGRFQHRFYSLPLSS